MGKKDVYIDIDEANAVNETVEVPLIELRPISPEEWMGIIED